MDLLTRRCRFYTSWHDDVGQNSDRGVRDTPRVPQMMVPESVVAVHIGTSGWSYLHWAGVLYPEGVAPERRLDYYIPQFRTAELNASYYRWPPDGAFEHWRRRLPSDFVLSVKAPRALTHAKQLFGPEQWLARIARSFVRLGRRRGVLLVQLPPAAAIDHGRLAYFLKCVPAELKVAVEFRNSTWHQENVFGLLGNTIPPTA